MHVSMRVCVVTVLQAFGDRLLLEDMTFSVPPGARVGIIGGNGAGTWFSPVCTTHAPALDDPSAHIVLSCAEHKCGHRQLARDVVCVCVHVYVCVDCSHRQVYTVQDDHGSGQARQGASHKHIKAHIQLACSLARTRTLAMLAATLTPVPACTNKRTSHCVVILSHHTVLSHCPCVCAG